MLAWQGYAQYSAKRADAAPSAEDVQAEPSGGFETTGTTTPASFRCDGRTHCSQMSSCAEGEVLSQQLPGRQDGRGPRRRAVRAAMVQLASRGRETPLPGAPERLSPFLCASVSSVSSVSNGGRRTGANGCMRATSPAAPLHRDAMEGRRRNFLPESPQAWTDECGKVAAFVAPTALGHCVGVKVKPLRGRRCAPNLDTAPMPGPRCGRDLTGGPVG
jgi:hypothetical protein